jgi:hypothetical protein
MPDFVAEAEMRSVDPFQNEADRVRQDAYEQAWAALRPELGEFSESEILSIRSTLAQSILEVAEQGGADSARLCVSALQKLSAYLRGQGSNRFDSVS